MKKREPEIQCPTCNGWGNNRHGLTCQHCKSRGITNPPAWPNGETFVWFAAGVCFVIALVLS